MSLSELASACSLGLVGRALNVAHHVKHRKVLANGLEVAAALIVGHAVLLTELLDLRGEVIEMAVIETGEDVVLNLHVKSAREVEAEPRVGAVVVGVLDLVLIEVLIGRCVGLLEDVADLRDGEVERREDIDRQEREGERLGDGEDEEWPGVDYEEGGEAASNVEYTAARREGRCDNDVLIDILLDEDQVGNEGLDRSAEAPDDPDSVDLKGVERTESVPRGVTVQGRVVIEVRVLAADVHERMMSDDMLVVPGEGRGEVGE